MQEGSAQSKSFSMMVKPSHFTTFSFLVLNRVTIKVMIQRRMGIQIPQIPKGHLRLKETQT